MRLKVRCFPFSLVSPPFFFFLLAYFFFSVLTWEFIHRIHFWWEEWGRDNKTKHFHECNVWRLWFSFFFRFSLLCFSFFAHFKESGTFADTKLVLSTGKTILAHKLILCYSSALFYGSSCPFSLPSFLLSFSLTWQSWLKKYEIRPKRAHLIKKYVHPFPLDIYVLRTVLRHDQMKNMRMTLVRHLIVIILVVWRQPSKILRPPTSRKLPRKVSCKLLFFSLFYFPDDRYEQSRIRVQNIHVRRSQCHSSPEWWWWLDILPLWCWCLGKWLMGILPFMYKVCFSLLVTLIAAGNHRLVRKELRLNHGCSENLPCPHTPKTCEGFLLVCCCFSCAHRSFWRISLQRENCLRLLLSSIKEGDIVADMRSACVAMIARNFCYIYDVAYQIFIRAALTRSWEKLEPSVFIQILTHRKVRDSPLPLYLTSSSLSRMSTLFIKLSENISMRRNAIPSDLLHLIRYRNCSVPFDIGTSWPYDHWAHIKMVQLPWTWTPSSRSGNSTELAYRYVCHSFFEI